MHTSNYPILLSKLYIVATPEHFRPLLLEISIRVIALVPDLRTVSFHHARVFFNYSSTNKLLLLLILIKGPYLIFEPFLLS
jgi:hypothetical protein